MNKLTFEQFEAEQRAKRSYIADEDVIVRALGTLDELIEKTSSDGVEKKYLERLSSLIHDNLDAIEANPVFFRRIMPIVEEILEQYESEAIDGAASYSPILKEDADIATIAQNAKAFLMHFEREKHKTLNALICELMRKKGFDNPADVWRPVGIGRKRWSNLLNRYNDPEAQAPKLMLLQVAIALRLDFEETNQLLAHQCYRLTKSQRDLVFVYHIMNRLPFEAEKNHTEASKREADSVRNMLSEMDFKTISEIYD